MIPTTLRRSDALDALRGLAILLMVLSGSIHFPDPLPAWMYHAQVPPPDFKFDPNLPGITWVDLVFPFFLFAMGAAFPFGLTKRLESGVSLWTIIFQSVLRGLMLVAFAIFLQHTKPFLFSSDPTALDWVIGLLAFGVMFLLFMRHPASWSRQQGIILRSAGLVTGLVILTLLTFPDGTGFLITRSDIIIIVLANVAVFGSLLWVATRNNILLRLGVLGILMALRLTQSIEGSWNQWLWTASPFPWMYKLYYLQYLFIVIPGSIAGDLIHGWINQKEPEAAGTDGLSRNSMLMLFGVMVSVLVITVAGLFAREVLLTMAADAALLAFAYTLLRRGLSAYERLLTSLFRWGTFWLLLGFFFEAYEGGIKKDRATVSYYFVTSGLAVYCYIAFSIIADRFRKSAPIALLVDNGKNPMIAYVAGNVLILPILSLTSLNLLLNAMVVSPWLGFLKGVIFTLLVAFVTQFFTKKGLFWRT
jgi:predicted acyltransferase